MKQAVRICIAVPPADLKEDLQSRLKSGEAVELCVLRTRASL